jgi:biotin transport system substrate-specific component
VLLGPTAGYLLAYPLAALGIGAAVHGGRTLIEPNTVGLGRLVGALVLGTALIYASGVLGLMAIQSLGPVEAFLTGAAAFVPAELLKIVAAIGIVRNDAMAAA